MTTNPHDIEDKLEMQMSSGNVFADLGFKNSEEMLLKSELVRQINLTIVLRQLDEKQTREILDIDENTRSNLAKGRLTELTIEQLFRYLNIFGRDLEIVLKPASISRDRGNLKVKIIENKALL
jgi:predicted XRE-type DNA-binding protein